MSVVLAVEECEDGLLGGLGVLIHVVGQIAEEQSPSLSTGCMDSGNVWTVRTRDSEGACTMRTHGQWEYADGENVWTVALHSNNSQKP